MCVCGRDDRWEGVGDSVDFYRKEGQVTKCISSSQLLSQCSA